MSDEQTDDLALAVHCGKPEAVACLVRRYGDGLYGYALRLLGDSGEAQEVVQDAFLRAHTALTSRYSAEQCRTLALRPWLFRITRNLALNRRRAQRGRHEEPLPEPDGSHPPALRCDEPLGARLERQADRARLEQALAGLNASGREAIVLRFVEELSYAEIAAVVGAGEAVVRGRVFRALRHLRAALEKMEADDDL